jgi:hypothetical protein
VYVTWSDEPSGEYCVWVVRDSGDIKAGPKIDYTVRLLQGKGFDRSYFEVS